MRSKTGRIVENRVPHVIRFSQGNVSRRIPGSLFFLNLHPLLVCVRPPSRLQVRQGEWVRPPGMDIGEMEMDSTLLGTLQEAPIIHYRGSPPDAKNLVVLIH